MIPPCPIIIDLELLHENKSNYASSFCATQTTPVNPLIFKNATFYMRSQIMPTENCFSKLSDLTGMEGSFTHHSTKSEERVTP